MNGVDLSDVRMIDRSDGSGFGEEFVANVVVILQSWMDPLDGDSSLQGGIMGPVDDSHSALTDLLFDQKLTDLVKAGGLHRLGVIC